MVRMSERDDEPLHLEVLDQHRIRPIAMKNETAVRPGSVWRSASSQRQENERRQSVTVARRIAGVATAFVVTLLASRGARA